MIAGIGINDNADDNTYNNIYILLNNSKSNKAAGTIFDNTDRNTCSNRDIAHNRKEQKL